MRLVVFILCFVSSSVYAAHTCVGKVLNIDIASNGNVQVNIAGMGDGNGLCSVSSTRGEFTAEACKATLSLLLAAQMSGKNVRLHFRNDTNTSCNKGSWIEYSTHGVYYVRLE